MKLNTPLLLALAVLVASVGSGCLGALKKDEPTTPASDDGDDTTPDGTKGGNGKTAPPKVVNDRPVAKFRITNDVDPANETNRGFKGDVLKLDATASTDKDGVITNWTWELLEPTGGDAPPAPRYFYGEVVKNLVFGTEGVKIIRLTVTDNAGAKETTAKSYYRDVSYAYGDQFHWTQITETVTETREHKLPVLAGAAALAAKIVVTGGAKAAISLVDPDGTEHAAGTTETDNVTITMADMAVKPGDWTIKVTITYEPQGLTECGPAVGCQTLPVPFEPSHDASYGLDGLVWYGEKPQALAAPGDGHGHGGH